MIKIPDLEEAKAEKEKARTELERRILLEFISFLRVRKPKLIANMIIAFRQRTLSLLGEKLNWNNYTFKTYEILREVEKEITPKKNNRVLSL